MRREKPKRREKTERRGVKKREWKWQVCIMGRGNLCNVWHAMDSRQGRSKPYILWSTVTTSIIQNVWLWAMINGHSIFCRIAVLKDTAMWSIMTRDITLLTLYLVMRRCVSVVLIWGMSQDTFWCTARIIVVSVWSIVRPEKQKKPHPWYWIHRHIFQLLYV